MYRLILFLIAAAACAQDRYAALMKDLLIFDAHIDTPRFFLDEGYRLKDAHPYYELDLPRMRTGHVGAVMFGIYAEPSAFAPTQWLQRSLEVMDAFHQEMRLNPGAMEVAYSADDIERIHRSGKIAALTSLEGGHLIGDSARVLRNFHRLGVRSMTLAHFKTNNFADSMTDVAAHRGISPFGKELIGEMNRMGMMIDVSHISDKAVLDAVQASRAPVIASHSSVKSIANIPRNMPDDVIRAVASKGGVICINFHAGYLDPKAYDVYITNRPKRDAEIQEVLALQANNPQKWELVRGIQRKYFQQMPKVEARALLRHIDYVAKLVGPAHVGLGSDFDGISGMVPVGVEDVSKYPTIVKGLIELGYSDADIRKIMGGNLVAALRASEAAAKQSH